MPTLRLCTAAPVCPALALVAIGAFACASVDGSSSVADFPIHARVAEVLAEQRPFEARLSGSRGWVPCTDQRRDSLQPSVMCSGYRANIDALTRAGRPLRGLGASSKSRSSDIVWSEALIALSAHPDASQIDEVIDRLRSIADASEPSDAVRNDLGIAYMARAELRHEAMDEFQALDQLERAYERNPTSPLIAFNRAIALERLHLGEMAADAWRLFLRIDSTSQWSGEGRAHLALAVNSGVPRPEFNSNAEHGAELASDPQSAREWVLRDGIGDWARLCLAADEAGARGAAGKVAVIGDVLARTVGDSSVARLGDEILRGSASLARAAVVFEEAQASYRRGDFLRSAPKARAAIEQLRLSGGVALADWAELLLAGVDVTRADFTATKHRTSALFQRAIRHHAIAVAGRALWFRALAEARDGEAAQAVDDYRSAAELYARIGERNNQGSMLDQQGDVLYLLGQDDVAIDLQLRGLALLGERRNPVFRAGPLLAIGRELGTTGLSYGERAVLREAVLSGAESERVQDLPEALLRLAAAEANAGLRDGAAATLDRANAALHGVQDTLMRDRMQMEVASVQATILTKPDPVRAMGRFDAVASYFRSRDIKFDLAAPLVRAARLRLQLGDTVAAEGNLAEAVATVESQSLDRGDRSGQRMIASVRRDVYNALAAIHLARGDTVQAFIISERARGHRITRLPPLRSGELALSYSTYEDRTIGWVLSGGRVRAVSIPAGESQFARLARELEEQLRSTGDVAEPSIASRRLYDLLIAPANSELRAARMLRIVADGALVRVPFAGLKRADGKYLIELLPIIYGSAVRPTTNRRLAARRLLIVGDPAFDSELFPALSRLRAAHREGELVRAAYVDGTLLVDTAATKATFTVALRSAGMLHFAGHAVLVERAPLLSHLVLARDTGGVPANTLSAAEIEKMDLHNLQLVVLSACGTIQGRNSRDANVTGLAQPFLDAGVPAVISSLWAVDDEATASLMRDLHNRLASGQSPADALRDAQITSIKRDSNRTHGSWSAFRLEED